MAGEIQQNQPTPGETEPKAPEILLRNKTPEGITEDVKAAGDAAIKAQLAQLESMKTRAAA